jgi:hypothetical protein
VTRNSPAHYAKTIAAFVGTSLTWAGVAYVPDGHVNRGEWFALAVALATSAGVYGITNRTDAPTLYTEADAAAQAAS